MKNKTRGSIMLILAAFIWGTALVAQSIGMNYITPFMFNALRFLIGSFVLFPVIMMSKNYKAELKLNLKCGIYCGIILFITASLQQIGILYTTVGKAGFITSLYIVFVPIIGIFFGKKFLWYIWVCILIALIGIYMLCVKDSFTLGIGDTFVLVCAFTTAVHILLIGHFSKFADALKLSCIQFFVCGILSFLVALVFEDINLKSITAALIPVLYTGILSCAVAYTFQTLGQKEINPVIASLILSLESVFSVLSGFIMLNEVLSLKEVMGCILIFIAIILVQIFEMKSVN